MERLGILEDILGAPERTPKETKIFFLELMTIVNKE
jgi:hypothetical protein